MKLKLLPFLFLFVGFIGIQSASAQTHFLADGIVHFQSDSINSVGDTLNLVKIKLQLADTTDIANFHVKMGSTLHSASFFDGSFEFDENTGLPQGWAYERRGNEVYLTLGYYAPSVYYADIKIEDVFGNTGTIKTIKF